MKLVLIKVFVCVALFQLSCSEHDSRHFVENEVVKSTDQVPKHLSNLKYDDLNRLSGHFYGDPLWVSNNPEDVTGYGILGSGFGL